MRALAWCLLGVALVLSSSTHAIKFTLESSRSPAPFCIWNYALANTLAVVSINVVPRHANEVQYQSIDVKVIDRTHHNVYLNKRNLHDETRLAISTHHDADLGVCIMNHGTKDHLQTDIDLDVHLGGEAIDYSAIANQESLSGMETELRKLATISDEILDEMEYLKQREMRLSATHVSTLNRVHGFAWLSISALLLLGVWQVYHLRGFFKRKYLID
ncbi:vesicle coat component [Malassezia sp. CBS 17886]|nr:vesicle coat component [Malassezia sp. CBS 17886]